MNVTECFDMATCGYDAGAGYAYDESDSYNCDDCHIGFDRETNLNYNYFRDCYDPQTGRYCQSDPIGLDGGINPYVYVENDPIGFVDPDGLTRSRGGGNPRNVVQNPGNQPGGWSYGRFYPNLGAVPAYPVGTSSATTQPTGVACSSPTLYGGAFNPGALSPKIANTFRSGMYYAGSLSQSQAMYRVISPGGNPTGSYWTTTPPSGPVASIINNALLPQWGNNATVTVTAIIPAGTTVYYGSASSQGGLVGGGVQVYIPQVNPAWVFQIR